MKLTEFDRYSVLILKGAQKRTIEESWCKILQSAYVLSKEITSYFPLPRDLIEPVDQIFDDIVDSLGTDYRGLRYLTDFNEERIRKLLLNAFYTISDCEKILKISVSCKKPCVYFNDQIERCLFIPKVNKYHQNVALNLGFLDNEINYY